LGQFDRVRCCIRTGSGDNRDATARNRNGDANKIAMLPGAQRWGFARRPADDKRSRPVRDLKIAKLLERATVDISLVVERGR